MYDLGVFPSWKLNAGTSWQHMGISAGFNARYIQGFRECKDNNCNLKVDASKGEVILDRRVSANFTADVFASYTLESTWGRTRITGGMNNVFDTDPPFVYNGFTANTSAANYDFLGRYPYLRFSHNF